MSARPVPSAVPTERLKGTALDLPIVAREFQLTIDKLTLDKELTVTRPRWPPFARLPTSSRATSAKATSWRRSRPTTWGSTQEPRRMTPNHDQLLDLCAADKWTDAMTAAYPPGI